MIGREFFADRINAVINDPAVLPWVATPGQTSINLSGLVADANNVLLTVGPTGGFFFHQLELGVYEVHTFFLPIARGIAFAAFKEAMAWMFLRTNCMELLTKVPANNMAADRFAQKAGAVLEFERAGAWPTETGPVDLKFYALRYPDWVRTASGLVERVHWFHDRLEAEKIRLGSEAPIHDDDPAHDRHAGACVGMALGGQVEKAIVLYNRWAAFAGYSLIALNSRDPVVIDIGECLIALRGENFEVVPCPLVRQSESAPSSRLAPVS